MEVTTDYLTIDGRTVIISRCIGGWVVGALSKYDASFRRIGVPFNRRADAFESLETLPDLVHCPED